LNTKHYDRFETVYIVIFWLSTNLLNAWINAESVIDDHQRASLTTQPWEIYTWEFSSHILSLFLIPLVIWLNRRFPLTTEKLAQAVSIHFLISIGYSLLHVVGMVSIRKAVYLSMGSSYDFGDWSNELIYEYRKDGYAYAELLLIIYCYGFIISRLRGEAKTITYGEDQQIPDKPERLLVKKIGKEFIIRIEDIEWVEAAGNYMNLHIDSHIYPLRETMSNLESKLDTSKFARIHRSTIVNLDHIKEIRLLESGDYEVILNNQQVLKLSRRYRDKLKGVLL
jgi:hypothetical protein